MLAAGFALPVGVATLLWYLPVPRRWWFLAILVANFLMPAATGIVGCLVGVGSDERSRRSMCLGAVPITERDTTNGRAWGISASR